MLEKRPRWELELEAPSGTADGEQVIRGRPEARDVDGDGRAEVLVRGRRGGWSVLWELDPQ